MKKIYTCLALLSVLFTVMVACKKMDSTYDQFVVVGGRTYVGKATEASVYSGRQRVKIAWLRGADPNVVKAKIFWNNKQDSLNVTIPAQGDTVSVTIGNLEERSYSFLVKTYDANGNTSVPVELQGESFGEKYQSYLVERTVLKSEVDLNGKLVINWGTANVAGGAYATDVTYTSTDGSKKMVRTLIASASTEITDYKQGTLYQYKTVYRPGLKSMDSFYTEELNNHVAAKVEKPGLLVTTDSFAATSQLANGGGPAQFAFDDDVKTFWHTHHTPAPVPPFPHWLAVDLKKNYVVTRAELTCRPGVTNTFTAFTLQGSMDNKTWTNYGDFTLVQKDQTQSFDLNGLATMRYFRIYATAGPNAYANLAEFTVFGYPEN